MSDLRVLVVDDQDLVRAGFRIILQSEPGIEVVGEAANGEEALARAAELQPDVICMDVQMPVLDGLQATRLITAAMPGVGILILTTFDRDDYLFDALRAGASGFLLKNSTPEQLIEAVQIVGRGDALLSPDVTRRVIAKSVRGVHGSDEHPEPPSHDDERTPAPLAVLSTREAEVLGLVARGFSNSEIAAELYVGEATVKSHVSKIFSKLELRDRVQAVVFAYEHGVVSPGP